MDLSPEDVDALKSLGRYRLSRGTAEFFALRKEGDYDFKTSQRVPGLSPETLQRLLDAGLIQVQVQGQGGDLITLSRAGAEMVDELLADE